MLESANETSPLVIGTGSSDSRSISSSTSNTGSNGRCRRTILSSMRRSTARTGGVSGGGSSSIDDLTTMAITESFSFESFRNLSERVTDSMNRIGVLGSTAIAVNSLTGPAMLCLPDTYQRSGIIPTTVTILFICSLSALCCLHMSNVISKVENNQNFTSDIGYSEAFGRFWGKKSYIYTQVLFFCCITCLNVSSLVDTAQVADTFLAHWMPDGSFGINLQWNNSTVITAEWITWDYTVCSDHMLRPGECVPFSDDNDGILFTIGYAITLLVFLPMALSDLKENAVMQAIGFFVLLVTSAGFVVIFLSQGINLDNITLWGTEWGSLFGVILFNFALVIAIPAWLYEKESHVDVPTVVHTSSALSASLYVIIGLLGAVTMPSVSQNMLEGMMSGSFGVTMQIFASVFAFFIIGFGCPLFSILVRMNLSGSGLFSVHISNILGVYLPFFTSWVLYQGDWVTSLLSWGGMIFTSLVAFILPLMLSLHVLDERKSDSDDGSVNVYKPWHISNKVTQRRLLNFLLTIACISIFMGIAGNMPFITTVIPS